MRTTLLKFVLLFSLVLLNTSLSTGQIQYNNIRFKQLSIAEGLPHNTINAITQDNHGFIWFGTRNGLCRYDGYNINLFAHNEATAPHSATISSHAYITIRSVTFYGSLPIRASAAITTRQKISAVTRLKGTLRMMFVS
jgi:ligand-binding sensor domain-containing protein